MAETLSAKGVIEIIHRMLMSHLNSEMVLAGLQTFGGDMKIHIHEHCIIVDGGIDEYSQIVNVREIPTGAIPESFGVEEGG